MRLLIDGYNVMYANGLLGRRFGPDGFRRVRHRFLNELAAALGPVDAHATTVVFDAAQAPEDVPSTARHKGISVVYAVDDDDADARIERLIAEHGTPKTLTVVSSDARVRIAAERRRATALTADEFLERIETMKGSPRRRRPAPRPELDPLRQAGPAPAEAEDWLAEFGDLDADPETRRALNADPLILSDAEIAAIEREVEREFPGVGRPPRRGRGLAD